MSKFRLTIIADEDIIDELASYPDSRLIFEGDPEEISSGEMKEELEDDR